MNNDDFQLRAGIGGGDSTREIRAMSLAALPCPPLPIMTTKEYEGESNSSSSGYHIGNSHDLIGHFMNIRSAVCQVTLLIIILFIIIFFLHVLT